MALLFLEIILMSTYLAFLTHYECDLSLAIRLTVFPLTAPFIVLPVVYVASLLLNLYYLTYSKCCENIS